MKNNQLFTGSVLFFLIILAGLSNSFFLKAWKGYKVDNKSVHETIIEDDYLMVYHEYLQLTADDKARFMLVDLRDEQRYEAGHLDKAISIPAELLIDNQSLRKIKNHRNNGIILYSDSQETSTLACLMLKSLGYDNVRVLAGNYHIFTEKVLHQIDNAYLFYNEEKATWNYGNIIQRTESEIIDAPVVPAPAVPEGGC
ncbi:MAG: rhodanese-like domain-containing protein [Cyclonatronaceae bacterium]